MSSKVDSQGFYTLKYRPFIENHTLKLYHRFAERYDYEDMLSEAMIASLIAEKKYDPERSDFSGFVKKYIEGAVIRSVTSTTSRQQGLLLKVYRWIDDYVARMEAVPSLGMALQATDVNRHEYDKALASSEHLYRVPMEDVVTVSEESLENLEELQDAIERLPQKYRGVIKKYLNDKHYNKVMFNTAIRRLKEIING